MKLYEFIDECLFRYGCRKVFGVPGALVMPIWQNISNSDVILCSHEQEASYIATGFGKMTKKLTAVITIGAPESLIVLVVLHQQILIQSH